MLSSLSLVLASNGAETTANPIGALLPFLLIGVVFYLLIIRPQKKRQAEQQSMIRSLGVGDAVVSIGGIHGEIVGMTDDTIQLMVADGVIMTMARNAISRPQSTGPDPLAEDDDLFEDDLDDELDSDIDDELGRRDTDDQ